MKKLILLSALICAGQMYGMENLYEPLPSELKQVIISNALETSNTLNEAVKTIKKLSILHNVRYDNFKEMAALVNALRNKFPKKAKGEIILALEKPEIYEKIVTIMEKNKNMEQTIKAIKNENLLQDNLENFTTLVHILGYKFKKTSEEIAKRFEGFVSQKYLTLVREASKILNALYPYENKEKFSQLIQEGFDVNSTYEYYVGSTPYPLLSSIVTLKNIEDKQKLELIKILLDAGANPFGTGIPAGFTALDYAKSSGNKEIIQLFEEAIKKQQQ